MGELIARFVLGGLIVCCFSAISEVLKPKSFSGLFGAAPTVALATLGLTYVMNGSEHAAIEGRSMIAGSAAFFAYASVVSRTLMRRRISALIMTGAVWALWLAVAVGLWAMWLR